MTTTAFFTDRNGHEFAQGYDAEGNSVFYRDGEEVSYREMPYEAQEAWFESFLYEDEVNGVFCRATVDRFFMDGQEVELEDMPEKFQTDATAWKLLWIEMY